MNSRSATGPSSESSLLTTGAWCPARMGAGAPVEQAGAVRPTRRVVKWSASIGARRTSTRPSLRLLPSPMRE